MNKHISTRTTVFFILAAICSALLLLLASRNNSPPRVLSTNPPQSSVNVDPTYSPIIVFDKKPIKPDLLTIASLPDHQFDYVWNENKLTLKLKAPLLIDQQYTFKVAYNSKPIAEFSYVTAGLTRSQMKEVAIQQVQDDVLFTQEQLKVYREKPWLEQLPIKTEDYRVVYDYELQKLRIRILTTSKNRDTVTQEALTELTKRNIPYQTIGYSVINN